LEIETLIINVPIPCTCTTAFRAVGAVHINRLFSFGSKYKKFDRLCGLAVRVLGYRSGGPGSIPGTTRKKKVVGLERGSLRLVSTTEELLDRKVAAPV
jgi:hypothetical protein